MSGVIRLTIISGGFTIASVCAFGQQVEVLGDGYLKSRNARDAERVYHQAIALDAENASLAGKLAKAQHS
ncbi:MAG: hypothetical protein ABIP78_11465 [Pyrinomonadaceae bacterium]